MKKSFNWSLWIFFLLFFGLLPLTVFAINVNPISMKGMTQAYGFVIGQEYSLSRIEKEFPELTGEVELARTQFDSTFPGIKTKLEVQLKQAMSPKHFQETATNLQSKLREILGRQQVTHEFALKLLEQVKARSKGEIESPVLEYLLAVKYTANPVGEFSDGFRQHYSTDGKGKSKGIKLRMQIPRSWAGKVGDRPHIVQKWTSENGTGLEMFILDIRDSQWNNPSKKEIENFVKSGELKEIVPEGSSYVASGNFSIEGRPGYWLQMTMSIERAGVIIHQDIVAYQFFFRSKAIGLMCQAAGPVTEKLKIKEAFKRIRPLCQQVLNSLVLEQAY